MKQIYEQGTLQMVRSENNLVFVAKQDEHEGKTSIVYRMYDCGTERFLRLREVFSARKIRKYFRAIRKRSQRIYFLQGGDFARFPHPYSAKKRKRRHLRKRTAKSSGAATPFTRIRLLPPLPSPGTPFGRHIKIPRPLLPIPPSIISAMYPPYRGVTAIFPPGCADFMCATTALFAFAPLTKKR